MEKGKKYSTTKSNYLSLFQLCDIGIKFPSKLNNTDTDFRKNLPYVLGSSLKHLYLNFRSGRFSCEA